MCNAYMHPRNCSCGWGSGKGVGNSRSYLPSHEVALLDHANAFYRDHSSLLTIPNYSCSCGKKVFFFRSRNGGKVLFESLGPPWPKHDCLGLSYDRKKAQIKITEEWMNIGYLSATPAPRSLYSSYSGLLNDLSNIDPISISIELKIGEPLLVSDIYLNKNDYLSQSKEIEALILFDDGVHNFCRAKVTHVEPFIHATLSKRRYTKQPILNFD